MNILNSRKPFSSVLVGEEIYYIDPKTQETKGVTVTGSKIHPNVPSLWALRIYMPFRIGSVTDESLKEAKKFGTTVEHTIVMLKTECMVLLQSEIPMIFATEKKYIEEWKRGSSGLIQPKRNA